jgi:L-arabinonolactonase
MEIRPLDDSRCHLGEGPLWDVAEQALYWVDSLAPALYRHDWASRQTRRWDLAGRSVSSLAVRRDGGLVLAMDQGLHAFDPETGTATLIAEPFAGRHLVRFNDGKVDPAGRFIAGGMHGAVGEGSGPEPVCDMVSLAPDGSVRTLLGGFGCFNGPCFSPDGRTLYVAGRGDLFLIEAFAYDVASGTLGEGHVLIEGIDPDGCTVDAEGFLWSAQFGAGEILRIAPDGRVVDRIALPGQVTASVMFGGPGLDLMFVTTLGRPFWGIEPKAPDAGAVFVISDSGFRGLPEPRFAG